MKKFLLYASAVSAMMLAGSCQKEVLEPVSEGEASVKFSIALPDGLQTKAMSQAESTDIVYYEIWNSDWSRQLYPVEEAGVQSAYASAVVDGCKATIDLKLISDQTYNFIFWAQNEACGAYDVTELKNVGVNYGVIGAEGNQDKFDAFYAVETIRVEGPINKTITLFRPFAQLNFGADEMTTTFGDIVVTDTEIEVSGLATVFNTLTGYGETPVASPVAFQAKGIATNEALVTGGKSYTWVAMDYMLMMDNQALVNVEASFGVDGMDDPVTHSLTNVPLKKNYRTNIVGDLFTTDAKLQIIVDPEFNQPDEILTIVDNSEALALAIAAAKDGDTIYISDEVTMPYFTGKILNFVGVTEDAVVKQSPATHLDKHYEGAELHFSNLTLVGTSYQNSTQGYQKAAKETYADCHFVNYIMFAGEETVVSDCTFENEGQYFWTGTAKNITFNDCVFDGTERAVKVCTVGNNGARVVTFNNCQFIADNQVKSALEIDGSKGSTYTVFVNGCTATGFATSDFTGESLFNIEGADKVTVYVDGNKWVGKGTYEGPAGETLVFDFAALQQAVDAAAEGTTVIKLAADMAGDLVVSQKPNVNIVLDGADKNYDGVIVVDGKSATYTTAGLTVKNMTFAAEAISADACIRLGNGTNATRYACNVTVENCIFDVPGAVAVKSYTGGDKNLAILGCTATEKAHSLVQVAGVDEVLVEGCTVNSKNGMNFNNSVKVTINECNADVKGYAARFGAGSAANGAAETYAITNSTLKSACEDGDAVIILRGTADKATLTLTNTTLVGTTEITNNAVDAQVIR